MSGHGGFKLHLPQGHSTGKHEIDRTVQHLLGALPDTEKIILRLESFASSLFSVSFMMFMMMLGAYFFLFVTIIVPVVGLIQLSSDVFDGVGGIFLQTYVLLMLGVGH